MKYPLVSIIIPAYNVADYLTATINSCINQSLASIEIIIINDGSVDQTQDVIDEFSKKDDRILSFTQNNKGVTKARSFGLEKSSGEYVFFLDGDDYIAIDALEAMYKHALIHNADFVVGDFIIVHENGKQTERKFLDFGIVDNIRFLEYCFKTNDFYFTGRLIRRTFIKSTNLNIPPNITFGEDNVAVVQVGYRLGTFVKLNKSILYYVQRAASVTNKLSLHDLKERWNANNFILKYINEKGLYDRLKSEIMLYFLRQIYFGIVTGYVDETIARLFLKKKNLLNRYFCKCLGFKQSCVLILASVNLNTTISIISRLKK